MEWDPDIELDPDMDPSMDSDLDGDEDTEPDLDLEFELRTWNPGSPGPGKWAAPLFQGLSTGEIWSLWREEASEQISGSLMGNTAP